MHGFIRYYPLKPDNIDDDIITKRTKYLKRRILRLFVVSCIYYKKLMIRAWIIFVMATEQKKKALVRTKKYNKYKLEFL